MTRPAPGGHGQDRRGDHGQRSGQAGNPAPGANRAARPMIFSTGVCE